MSREQITQFEALCLVADSEDNAKEALGDQWADCVMGLYENAMEEVLPEIEVEEHAQFTRALFIVRGLVHRVKGLDLAPQS